MQEIEQMKKLCQSIEEDYKFRQDRHFKLIGKTKHVKALASKVADINVSKSQKDEAMIELVKYCLYEL